LTRIKRQDFLPFSPPLIGDEEISEVVDTLRSGWLTTGPKTRLFEERFAAYLGAPEALALNSCTAGLHTGLVALGIGRGDEVVTTTMTFAASVNVIEHVGARPVLVDVQPDTLNIDPIAVERAITPRTKAILPVHYGGHPVDLDEIMDLARIHGLAVIEDAAHALPARYKGHLVGSLGNAAAFSFYATKNLTTGEGGMLTGDPDLIAQARVVSLHGMSRNAWNRYDKGGSWFYEIIMPGFKYNMTDVQASLGLWQLQKLEGFQARRNEIVERYNEAFRDMQELEIPAVRSYCEPAWHLYVLRLCPETLRIDRDQFVEELTDRNIGTSVHFIPIHTHPYYAREYGYQPDDFPVAYGDYKRMLSLPLSPRMTDQDVADVIDAVRTVVAKHRR
jgi:dTDP-4-amino-4,6-dideoxygalactose transaminase